MPKETFTVTLSWYSCLPTFGPALEAITDSMAPGKFLAELRTAGVALWGDTAYGPHTTIAFEAGTIRQGLEFANKITGVLHHAFTEMPWIYIRVGGKSPEKIVAELEDAINNAVADLRRTRAVKIFAHKVFGDIKLQLEGALDSLRG